MPLILPGIMAGALMSFVTAMNELSSSLVLYVGSTITMPVRIYLSVMDGEYGTASALSTDPAEHDRGGRLCGVPSLRAERERSPLEVGHSDRHEADFIL